MNNYTKVKPVKIRSIKSLPTAKIVALMYAPFGLIHTLIGLGLIVTGANLIAGIALLFAPVFLALFGFVATLVACEIYNWLSKKLGPIEVELEEEYRI